MGGLRLTGVACVDVAKVEFRVAGFEIGLGWVGCEPVGVGRGRVGFRSSWGGWLKTGSGGVEVWLGWVGYELTGVGRDRGGWG